jgi:hypothetical protein
VQRLNAASLDGDVVTDVPVVLKSEDSTLSDLTVAMIQSSSGKELTMFEKGIGVRRLMADGMEKPEIARRLGVSEKSIDNYLAVASVPAKARDLLLDGKVTSTQVLRAKGDADKLGRMVEKATASGRTRARPSDAVEAAPVNSIPVLGPHDGALPPVPDAIAADSVAAIADRLPDGLSFTVDIVKDADMGATLRQLATEIRKVVPHDQGDDSDAAHVSGTISVTVTMVAPAKAPRKRKAPATAVEVVETDTDLLAHAVPVDEL